MTSQNNDPTAEYENSSSVTDLELQLQNDEVGWKLKSLGFRDTGERKFTLASFETIPVKPLLPLLRLIEDPTGAAKPGDKEDLVCQGTASINGNNTKVAVFRKKAAAGVAGGGGAANPAPAPTPAAPAPAPAPVDDQGTGPEGNPNLNADGTPKTPAPKPPGGAG